MGTLFEPFIIAFWVFIVTVALGLLWLLGIILREAFPKSNTKKKKDLKTKEDETESTEKMKK